LSLRIQKRWLVRPRRLPHQQRPWPPLMAYQLWLQHNSVE
jgi:hypothetical protein